MRERLLFRVERGEKATRWRRWASHSGQSASGFVYCLWSHERTHSRLLFWLLASFWALWSPRLALSAWPRNCLEVGGCRICREIQVRGIIFGEITFPTVRHFVGPFVLRKRVPLYSAIISKKHLTSDFDSENVRACCSYRFSKMFYVFHRRR